MEIKKNHLVAALGLVLLNVVIYSALASFSLRPHREERMLPVMAFLCLACGLGGFFLPRLASWYSAGIARPASFGGWLRLFSFALIVILVPITSAPGYHFWLANEPSRYLAAAGIGLLLLITNTYNPVQGNAVPV